MILSIFLLILITLTIAVFLFFLFIFFLPSLRAQKINADDSMFSKEEVEAVVDENIFKRDGNFRHVDIGSERLLSLFATSAGNIVEAADFHAEQESLASAEAERGSVHGLAFWQNLYGSLLRQASGGGTEER